MNSGLFGMPRNGVVQGAPPYRFLDTYGLPAMPGDVSRFGAQHIRADAGAALPGVWRPVTTTTEASLSIERGCLRVDTLTAQMGGIWMEVAGVFFDVVLEVLLKIPPQSVALSYICGVFAGVGADAAAPGAGLRRVSTITVTAAGTGTAGKMVPVQVDFDVDTTVVGLTPTIETAAADAESIYLGASSLLVRTRRESDGLGGSYTRVFTSTDRGFNWTLKKTAMAQDIVTRSRLGLLLYSDPDPGEVRVSGAKFLDPNTAFPS